MKPTPSALIPDFDYGEEVTTELPTGIAFRLGLDIDADAVPDAVFDSRTHWLDLSVSMLSTMQMVHIFACTL